MNISKEEANIILTWKREDPEDVERARDYFLKLTTQGWLAARQNNEFRRILEFNPEYGEIWFIPISEGG